MRYEPHFYQTYAKDFILYHKEAAIFLDCGLGKTVVTLTAIEELLHDFFEIGKVLVIAPLRVARDTWPSEIIKWEHTRNIRASVVMGTPRERTAALMRRADVYIINRENVKWLIEESGAVLDFDMIVIDELSSFKSHQAKRFRSLLKLRPAVKRIVGLTGTPSANGLMDLWAEFRLLDMGKRLGKFISHYRNDFFLPDKRNQQMVFSYKPREGAEDEIYRRIEDITISMRSKDYLKMPQLISNSVRVAMVERERELYERMKRDMVVALGARRLMPSVRRHFPGNSSRWQTEPSIRRTGNPSSCMTANWMHSKILSRVRMESPYSSRTGIGMILRGSRIDCPFEKFGRVQILRTGIRAKSQSQ